MDLIEKAKKHWFIGVVSIAIICISITWVVFNELFVKPRDFTIEQQEKEIAKLKVELDDLRRIQPILSEGRIKLPSECETVPMEFSFEVEILRNKPGKYYYLVNEVGGLYWPKLEINPNPGDRRTRGQIVEAGNPPGGIFHLVLIEVDEIENQKIKNWFEGGIFSEIERVGKVLHRIQLRLR